MITIQRTTTSHPDFLSMVAELDLELDDRYGIIQLQYKDLNKVEQIETAVVAYIYEKPVGCGCFKKFDEEKAELKRFYLKSEFRGKGIADAMLTELEQWAVEIGMNTMILETGTGQPDAVKFYIKKGFTPIENFGPYVGKEHSKCFEKNLMNI
jgi:GNAT superfamily N-acetyltransferase